MISLKLFGLIFLILLSLSCKQRSESEVLQKNLVENTKDQTHRVHIWIKSFIPNSHPTNRDYINKIAGKDLYVIEEPIGSDCAMTDNRLFETDVNASARMTAEFVFEVNEDGAVISPAVPRPIFSTGASRRVNCSTGENVETPKFAKTDNMNMGKPAFADGKAQVVIDCRASYPYFSIAPDVNFGGTFTYDLATKKLKFQGSVGVFPSFEAYAQLDSGPIATIFRLEPGNKTTIKSLIEFGTGLRQRNINMEVKLQ